MVAVGCLDDDDALRQALTLAGGSQLVIGVVDAVTVTGAVERLLSAFPASAEARRPR